MRATPSGPRGRTELARNQSVSDELLRMNVTVFNIYFGSESLGTGLVASDLAGALARAGHHVRVVTTSADYGLLRPCSAPSDADAAQPAGVAIKRIPVPFSVPIAPLRRAALYSIYLFAAAPYGLFGPRPDVVISIIPPSLAGVPAQMVARIRGASLVLDVEDLYGGSGFRSGFLGRCNAMVERWMLRKASCIRVLTEAVAVRVRSIAGHNAETRVVPVWTDPDAVTPGGDGRAFRREHGLDGMFVVLHSGNLGALGGQSVVLDTAERFRSITNLCFVFVGGGYGAAKLRVEASMRGLRNVRFFERVPRARLSDMLAAGDVALSTLDPRIRQTSIPSKTFTYMAAGLPVIAVLDSNNAASAAVEAAGCGWVVLPGSADELSRVLSFVMQLSPQARRAMGQAGRAYVERAHSKAACTTEFVRLIEAAHRARG
jgi:colanic acid biosynthesis glycosyl transferase WcaI